MSDWKKKIASKDIEELVTVNFIGWHKIHDVLLLTVTLTHNTSKSSDEISVNFDDISKGNFFCVDSAKLLYPFVYGNKIHHSYFCFQFLSDATAFVKLYGGETNWDQKQEES